MQKIVINCQYGGFNLSDEAINLYAKIKGEDARNIYVYNIERNDLALIQVIEELGIKAFGNYSNLKIIEIPDDVKWEIHEYDGYEHIAEKHRTWRG